MWESIEIQTFWKNTFVMIGKLTEENVPCEAKFCLFHIYPIPFYGEYQLMQTN